MLHQDMKYKEYRSSNFRKLRSQAGNQNIVLAIKEAAF